MNSGKVVMLIVVLSAAVQGAYVVEWSASGFSYAYSTVYSSDSTARYDANGDNIPDAFVSDSATLKIYSGVSRSLIWTITSGGYTNIGFPYIANTDGDAAKELVVSVYSYSAPSYSGRFYVYDCGTHAQEFVSPVKSGYPSIAVADVDGDNKSEICIVSGTTSRTLEVYGSDAAGAEEMPAEPQVDVVTAVPNPTTGQVMLSLPATRGSVVEVSDAAGRVVRRFEASGSVAWDCRDEGGQPVPAGVYLYRQGDCRGRVTVAR